MTYEYGAGLWLFGQFIDRYATDAYGDPVSTLEAIDRAGQVGRLACLDVNFPFSDEGITVDQVAAALQRNGLRAAAVTPAIYTRRFRNGSFTNPDPVVRDEAIGLCKRATDVAAELGADYLKFWPGQDGHDYPFQVDHGRLWHDELDGIGQVVSAAPEMQFAIEYKLKEPRVHMLLATAATTLLAIDEIGAANLGIVLDFGHSLFAKESPAAALEAVHRRGRLVSVEVNDNRLEWDDDLTVGSNHPIETLEFLLALRGIGWERPLLLDQFPFREDPVTAARQSVETIDAMERLLDRIDVAALDAARSRHDALAAQRIVLDELFPPGERR
jgi:xylose isomerase